MLPPSLLYFMVILATAATVIASQVSISGAFSLTLQAVQLGYIPRLRVDHTSALEKGQIYVPTINWFLMSACIGLVLGFRTSSNLAAAYESPRLEPCWQPRPASLSSSRTAGTGIPCEPAPYAEPLRSSKACSLPATSSKFPKEAGFRWSSGSALPATTTWKRGRQVVAQVLASRTVPIQQLLDNLRSGERPLLERRAPRESQTDNQVVAVTETQAEGEERRKIAADSKWLCIAPARVAGTAVFMYGNRRGTPPAMLSNLRHNKVLHERIVLVAVEISDRPAAWICHERSRSFPSATGLTGPLHFGYMDKPNLPEALGAARCEDGMPLITDEATFFLGKETLIPRKEKFSGMPHWREKIFAFMSRNAQDATAFFGLPAER